VNKAAERAALSLIVVRSGQIIRRLVRNGRQGHRDREQRRGG
jgi:hypothetical protein